MLTKEKSINLLIAILLIATFAVAVWVYSGVRATDFGSGFLTLAALTIFSSCYLRIQLPRVNLHITISDGLIIVAMLIFGGQIAVLLAGVEAAIASLYLRRRGVTIRKQTILVNTMIATLAAFATFEVATSLFRSTDVVLQRGDLTGFIWLLVVMGVSQFVVNSMFASIFISLKTKRPFTKVWAENSFDTALMYIVGPIVAGISLKALQSIDIYLLTGIISVFGLVYLTFRRFVNDVKSSVEKAQQVERERAELAERHVQDLQHYVIELERSSAALKESHENFRHAAYNDSLTGLPNRNFFLDKLKDLLLKSRTSNENNFAVLFLDLKSFKTINDSLGHSMGDRLIKNVAKRLSGIVRENDSVGRFSGDKFGIILTELLSKEEATGFADRLAKRLAEPYTLDGRQVFTSAKIGIAYGNSKYPEAEDILRDADIAMYYAKENNEDFVIFDQKMHIRAVTRLQLETDLRFAIERNEFELYYQPIIGLESATLEGFEALVRWNHPQRGLIPPYEFIPISESTGLIIPMTVKILHAACSQIVKWQAGGHSKNPLSIAVNLSGKHFGHPALVDQINTVIEETGINPSNLKLELTESAVMENAENAIQMLKQIKKTGVQISIDDFGTGYSSLSYLHRFPIDLLKVDRSFVSAMEENSENGEIVRTVVALAKALNLKVVAEGIESIHQFHQLRILGCEYGQGYLFSKPLPISEIERLLADNNRWHNILPSTSMPPVHQKSDISHLRLAQ